MANKWDNYVVEEKPINKWDSYSVKENVSNRKKISKSKVVINSIKDIVNMPRTDPEMFLSGVGQAGKDMFTIPAHFFNQLSLNNIRGFVNKMGLEYPETTNPIAKPLSKIAGVAGMITSPLGKAIQGVGKIPAGAKLGTKILQGMKVGGLGGVAYSPTEDIVGIPQRLAQGAVGAATGGLTTFMANLPKLVNLGGRKTAQVIAEKADEGFTSLSKNLSNKYDNLFGNIKGKVKVSDIVDDIQNTIDEFPEGANVGKLKSILKRVKGSNEISASELFNIKKEVSKTIPKSVWNGISDGDAMTNSKEKLYWKLHQKLEDTGGEKYTGLTEEYKKYKQAERLAKKMFYRNGVPSNEPLKGVYDIPTQRAVKKLSSDLPSDRQFANEFEVWRRGQDTKKIAAGFGGLGLLGYLTHAYIREKMLGNK